MGRFPPGEEALDAVDATPKLSGAILDINLRGTTVFPVADRLMDRNVPFFFTTGYDENVILDRYAGILPCEKPVTGPRLRQTLARSFNLVG